MATMRTQAMAPIKHLRNLNPYVVTALADWRKYHTTGPTLPRQGAGAGVVAAGQLAGTSSMGMSGVNTHLLLSAPSADGGQGHVKKVRKIMIVGDNIKIWD